MIRRKTKSNPTDHNLISKLTVKKFFPRYGIRYEVYLDKKRIGFASIDEDQEKNTITDVDIIEKYRRKGVSTFLYDYIEKDLGCKLKPSNCLLDDGEAFWKARSKRSNPTEKGLAEKLKIKKVKLDNQNNMYVYNVDYYDSELENWNYAGAAIFDLENKYVLKIQIMPYYRRRGIANYVYNYIENDWDIKLKSSGTLWPDGEKFWENRLKKNPSPKRKPRKSK